jgi:hypothetical protein
MSYAPVTEQPHDRSRLHVRAILFSAGGVVCIVILAAFVAHLLTGARGLARSGPTETSPPTPHLLESDPVTDRNAYELQKQRELNSYGWTNDAHTLAHVPIERAMQLLEQQEAHR